MEAKQKQMEIALICLQQQNNNKVSDNIRTLGVLPYKSDGDLVGKIKLNPSGRPMWVCFKLKLTPKGDHTNTDITVFFVHLFMHGPKRYLNGQI